ncbi:hypothetical protein NA57DRAFT_79686 [Rhizodiscina lignyota]|uniref:F-box domain-containing protein n=1 Tax=Rhizodiscina lignyota TaxID=1504668 RepID=A0A9P4M6V0_9PEZI|nr:hypothetical protein NA57DRAFT_79686 [Rhizodiscina lignyota]
MGSKRKRSAEHLRRGENEDENNTVITHIEETFQLSSSSARITSSEPRSGTHNGDEQGQNSSQKSFLDLPAELRLQVYQYVLDDILHMISCHPFWIHLGMTAYDYRGSDGYALPSVCRLFRAEILPLVFGKIRYEFVGSLMIRDTHSDLRLWAALEGHQEWMDFASPVYRAMQSYIQKLRVCLWVPASCGSTTVPTVDEMENIGSYIYLDFRLLDTTLHVALWHSLARSKFTSSKRYYSSQVSPETIELIKACIANALPLDTTKPLDGVTIVTAADDIVSELIRLQIWYNPQSSCEKERHHTGSCASHPHDARHIKITDIECRKDGAGERFELHTTHTLAHRGDEGTRASLWWDWEQGTRFEMAEGDQEGSSSE